MNQKLTLEELIANTLNIPLTSITLDLEYSSIPEWDSMGHISLMITIEDYFGRKINQDLAQELTSVRLIHRFLNGNNGFERRKIDLMSKEKIHRGLNQVYFDWTKISHVDGKNGNLIYRGYSIENLINLSNFEEVSFLLIHGYMPNLDEFELFKENLRKERFLPKQIIELIQQLKNHSPIETLRTCISALSFYDENRFNTSSESLYNQGLSLISKIPIILCYHNAFSRNTEIINSNLTLNHVENFLYLFFQKNLKKEHIEIFDKDLIIHADHGSNASTFSARISVSTEADIYSSVCSAISAFSGLLHGGATLDVIKMLNEIGNPINTSAYVDNRIKNKKSIPGFGHRVYKTEDPRTKFLKKIAEKLSYENNNFKYIEIINSITEILSKYEEHGLVANVDLYTGVIYSFLGFKEEYFVSLFIMGRISGWISHIIEQKNSNILIRPLLKYIGENNLNYSSITERT